MRDIKFRAWAIASNRMFLPDTADGWDVDNGKLHPLPNTILMQYTGLKDKSGKDLDWWEGDLIEFDGGSSGVWPIVWDDKGACFMCGDDLLVNAVLNAEQLDSSTVRKVGNIHENPELLGE